MRIVQIIDQLHIGGAERLQITFAEGMKQRNLKTTVFALRTVRETPIPAALQALGVEVRFFPAPNLLEMKRIMALTQAVRDGGFDLIHTHLTYANVLGGIAGKLAGIPTVATLHSAADDPSLNRNALRLERLLLHYGARRVIAVGDTVAEVHRPRLGNRWIDVIPNAVASPATITTQEREQLRTALIGDPSRPLLIAVGRLNQLKGYPVMLEAFAELRARHPRAALLIAGGGEMEHELLALRDSLGLAESVRMLGSRNDIPQLLAAADLYLNASFVEGMPVAVLEAMAAGLPVVATAVGDVPRVVTADVGVIVAPGQPAALAAATADLLDDPQRRHTMSVAARAMVQAQYSREAWIDRLLALYAEVMTPRASTHATRGAA